MFSSSRLEDAQKVRNTDGDPELNECQPSKQTYDVIVDVTYI